MEILWGCFQIKHMKIFISPYVYVGLEQRQLSQLICQKIANTVCKHFDITIEQLRDKSRKREVVKPRHIAMYLMREQEITLEFIGDFFLQDHTSVIWACTKINNYIDTEPPFKEEINQINSKLNFIK